MTVGVFFTIYRRLCHENGYQTDVQKIWTSNIRQPAAKSGKISQNQDLTERTRAKAPSFRPISILWVSYYLTWFLYFFFAGEILSSPQVETESKERAKFARVTAETQS